MGDNDEMDVEYDENGGDDIMINDPEDQGEDDVGDDDANESEKQNYSVRIA